MRYRMPGRPWFENLTKGIPAKPVSWEGWAFTGAYVAGLASLAHAARVLPPYPQPPLFTPFLLGAALLSGCFMVFCWLKSEELSDPVDMPKHKVEIVRSNDDEDPPRRWL